MANTTLTADRTDTKHTDMNIVTITRRNRNLGLGWTNEVEQVRTANGSGYLQVRQVTTQKVTGGLRAVRAEAQRAHRGNSGNDYAVALFVGGRRVLERVGDVFFDLDQFGSATVHVADD